MGMLMTRPLDQIRKRVGVPPMGPTGITSRTLNMIPLSPNISHPNPLWEPRHHMTGYWFAPSPVKWNPPADLLAFLESGEPPVVICLGAMALSGDDALNAAQITISAVQQAGVRAIIQGWDGPMKTLDVPANIYHADSIPHNWLLERACAIVHHGGFGTTAAGFRAGIPALVIPHIIDQFIWGQKVAELGVGPKPIPRAKLTRDKLAQSIIQALTDVEMRARAAEVGANIRNEPDGIAEAVRLIDRNIIK